MHARAAAGRCWPRLRPGGPRLRARRACRHAPVADSVPHFFDGFRTSHEINKIALIDEDVIRSLIPRRRRAGLPRPRDDPDCPVVRGTAQNPDAFFQLARREPVLRRRAGHRDRGDGRARQQTGRRYGIVDYHGAPDADRVIVIMAPPPARCRNRRRPQRHCQKVACSWSGSSSRSRRMRSSPRSRHRQGDRGPRPDQGAGRRRRAVLPGRRDPLSERMDSDAPRSRDARVIGGRYGLSSKEVTRA